MGTKTRVIGTLTFESEQDGRRITRPFPAFDATEDAPYINLVDEAIELVYDSLPALPEEYAWVQISEAITEIPVNAHNDRG